MASASDTAILEEAAEQGRAVVTLDSDFAQLVAMRGLQRPSIVHLRLQGLDLKAASEVLLELLPDVGADLDHGAIVSVTTRGYRVRRLPVARPGSDGGDDVPR